ncbi:UBB [Symbiodinium sp. CCMP2456]|nr:UBB [Symbiodinium sp. CCMP2456]
METSTWTLPSLMSLMSLSPCAGDAPSVHSGDSTAEMVVRAATAMPEAPMSLSKIVQAEIEDESIRLAVLMVSGRALVLQARTLQTVAELKSDIETKERIPVQEQSLLFQDEILQNSRKLHEYGLRHDSCISLVRVQPMELKIMTARVKWNIRVQPQDSVEELKAFVNEKMSIPFEQMLFVCRGKPLDDGRSLQEMGVETGDQVAMILRLKGCGQFIVETDGGTSFRVDGACADKTISEVKTAIRDRTGMAPAEQQLTFRKQVLEDAQTLEYYGIKRECKIQLARRQPQETAVENVAASAVERASTFAKRVYVPRTEDQAADIVWKVTHVELTVSRIVKGQGGAEIGGALPQTDYGDDHYVAANMKIASHPGHYMNHEASHLINPLSVEYWASLPGQVRDQAFAFEFEQGHVLAAVEWKDRGDGMGVQRLSLEAKVNGEWQKLSTWEAARKPVWQVHKMTMSMRSSLWRLTFLQNHGDENHLVVQAVRFVIKLQKTEPAHNVGYPQKITRQIWGDRRFTDVEVICGEQHFPVHRAVLAAASTVFAAMLGAEMKESHVLCSDIVKTIFIHYSPCLLANLQRLWSRLPLLRPMFANVYANCAKFRRKRVVVDSVISEEEARVYTHDAKDAHGDPLFHIDETFGVDAECSTAFQDWPDNPLNQEIPDRIRFLIRRHFSEKRPLYLVGAMLRRTRPGGECGYDRGPTVCHVDKANISYYDYSAILYLSTKGTDFEGGQLAFNDPCRDELVEPRLGRCVMFASGPHHLHQAKAVTSGTRMIMAMWYSLNCKLHGERVHMVREVVLGHKYDIPGLVEYAAPVALGNINPENCVSQVRILRAYHDDERLGPVFEALLNKIHESPQIFKSVCETQKARLDLACTALPDGLAVVTTKPPITAMSDSLIRCFAAPR